MGRKIPSLEEALAAKMAPVSMQPAPGPEAKLPVPASNDVWQESKDGQATAGGPQATNSDSDALKNGAKAGAGNKPPAATMGSGPRDGNAGNPQTSQTALSQPDALAAQNAGSQAPIGSTGQTLPAKFSHRNDVLDRVPTMAMPMALTDQQRQRIYRAVMADKSQTTVGADNLRPASVLSADVALNDTHPLPGNLQDMPLLKGLHYVKGKNKVLLIEPSTRVVFDRITS